MKYIDPLRTEDILERLKKEYKDHGKLIIAYDFDDTVCLYDKDSPEVTKDRPAFNPICMLLRRLRPYADFILWTCRSDASTNPGEEHTALQEAIMWLTEHNVPFDYINTDGKVNYGGRKIYANAFLDDRAGLVTMYSVLSSFLLWVTTEEEELNEH